MAQSIQADAGNRTWDQIGNWFEIVSIIVVIATGVWFTMVGDFVGSGRAWVIALLVIGSLAALAVVPLRNTGRHGLAASAALVSIVTPTGFAYVGNLLMIAVSVLEFARSRTKRST